MCKIGHMIPTGNNLDEFKCDNPECRMSGKNLGIQCSKIYR